MNINDITYKIIGAAMNVHKELGPGFLEAVYQEALAIELEESNILFEKEKKLNIRYKNKTLSKYYSADFLCENKVIVELKANDFIKEIDKIQALNYLKATGHHICLLINFGSSSLQYQRVVLNLKDKDTN
jgi:GxxExxY protein